MEFRDYLIRMWGGDISIDCRDHLDYATLGGASGMQCNCGDDDPLYPILKDKCRDVANAMRALDETVEEIERRRR